MSNKSEKRNKDTQLRQTYFAGELPEVTATPEKYNTVGFDKIIERKDPYGMTMYYYNNPDTGQEEMLKELGNGKYMTMDGRSIFDVSKAQAIRAEQAKGTANDFDKVMLGTLALGTAPITLSAAASTLPSLTPGSAFWTNPLVRQIAASTLTGETANTALKLTTGKTWGETMSNVVNKTTGWNPQNSWWGRMFMDASNPYYYTPARFVENAIGRVGNVVENSVGKAVANAELYNASRKPVVPEGYITVKPQVRTRVGDVEIDNPNLLYHLDRGDGVGAFSNQGAYVKNGILFPGIVKSKGQLGYSWWNRGKPYATAVNGQPMTRLMTAVKDTPGMLLVKSQNYPIGQWTGSKGYVLPSEYVTSEGVNVSESLYNWKPGYGYKKITQEPSTSLKFFERPSKISEVESLGFGKSRGFNPKFGDDIHLYYMLKDRRLTILDAIKKLKAPKDMGVDETISKNSGAIIDDGYLMSNGYYYTPVSKKHFSTGYNMSFGRLGADGNSHNYGLNLGGQATRVKDLDTTSEIVYSKPGANLNRNDRSNLDIVITASDNAANKESIQLLTKGMKNMESGAEFSGDASSTTAAEALSTWLRTAKNNPTLRKEAMSNARRVLKNNEGIDLGIHSINDPLHGIYTENATMSPDAYSYIYRTAANNPDKFHLGYQMNAGNFNSFARNPKNAYMYDVEQNYLDGLITPQEYVKLFNSWSVPLGGRRAYIYNGRVYKPQPFLIRNKQGGKVNTLEFLKNGSGIHIKKKNKGKFTDYCGGKVTSECIARGKRSPNPVIRKRATFAANARKWKHENGGLIVKALFGMSFNNLIKGVGSFVKNNKEGILDVAKQGISTIANNKLLSKQLKSAELAIELNSKLQYLDNYNNALSQQTDRSPIVNSFNANMIAQAATPGVNAVAEYLKAQVGNYFGQLKRANTLNFISSFSNLFSIKKA